MSGLGMSERGVIRTHASAERELEANRAKLLLRIEGETAFWGNAALTRSREVAALVTALGAQGVLEADLRVLNVTLAAQSGALGRSSRASFTLEVSVGDLERLPEHLGTVSSAKNIELLRLEWVYSGEDLLGQTLLGQATGQAQARAQAMADALGLHLAGLRSASDSSELPQLESVSFTRDWMNQEMERSRRRGAPPLELGGELRGRKIVRVQVQAEFWTQRPEDTQ